MYMPAIPRKGRWTWLPRGAVDQEPFRAIFSQQNRSPTGEIDPQRTLLTAVVTWLAVIFKADADDLIGVEIRGSLAKF